MLQQARKQLETELETTLHSFGDVCCLYTAVLVSPVQSIVQSTVQSTVQSMVQSRVQLLQRLKMYVLPQLTVGDLCHLGVCKIIPRTVRGVVDINIVQRTTRGIGHVKSTHVATTRGILRKGLYDAFIRSWGIPESVDSITVSCHHYNIYQPSHWKFQ